MLLGESLIVEVVHSSIERMILRNEGHSWQKSGEQLGPLLIDRLLACFDIYRMGQTTLEDTIMGEL